MIQIKLIDLQLLENKDTDADTGIRLSKIKSPELEPDQIYI